MALRTVDSEGSEDCRAKARWSAGKKIDVVRRLLRGEKLEELSRELGSKPIGSPPGVTSS